MNAPPKGAGWSLACAWGVFGFCRVLCPVCVCETESETRRAYVWRCGRAYSGLHALLLLVTRSHCDRTLPADTFSLSLYSPDTICMMRLRRYLDRACSPHTASGVVLPRGSLVSPLSLVSH